MNQPRTRYWYFGYGGLVLVAMLVCAFLFMRSTITVNAGVHDTWYVQHWYAPEQIAGRAMRWSEPRATLVMPSMQAGWHVAEVWLLNGRPNGSPAQMVTLRSAHLAPLTVTVAGWQLRRYAMLWHAPTLDWADQWTVTTPTPIALPEQRSVGILLAQWRTTPTTLASSWLSYVVLVLAGTVVVMWSVLTLSNVRSPWIRGALSIFVALVLAGMLAWRTSETLPWVHWPMVVGLVAVGWQVWVRLMGWLPPASQGRLVVDGRVLPLLMGSAWLVMPWLQYALMRADIYVRGLAIYPADLRVGTTIGIFVVTGMALLGRWKRWSWSNQVSQWAVLGICMGATVLYLVRSWQAIQHVGSADFDVWVIAARHWLATGSLYDVPQIAGDVFGYVYKYPPLYGMLFIPLAGYNEMDLLRVYRVIDIVLLAWTAAIWMHIIKPRQWGWWLGAVLIGVNLNPVLETLKYGQIDIVVVWLCSIIYWCLHHEHDDVAGWVVAFLVSIKMYPAVLLVWFVLQRRWHAVRGVVVGGVVLNLVGMAVVGWRDYYTFVVAVLPIIGGTTAYVENQTIAAFVARLIVPSYPLAPFTEPVWAPVTTLVSLVIMGGLFVVCARPVHATYPAHPVQFAIVVMMTAVTIPVAWIGYQVPLWLVFIIVLWHTAARPVPWLHACLVASSFALIGFGNFLSFIFDINVGWVTLITDSYKLYGMVMLTAVLCVWAWRDAKAA